MPTVNNKAIVDKAVSILSGLYKGVLRQHHLNGSVDFSGLSEQIMLAIQQGETGRIESIINSFVDGKIRNYDKVAGELAIKADKAANHRRTVDGLIGFSKTWNKQCATAIANNVTIEKQQTEKNAFRESLTISQEVPSRYKEEVSIQEAVQRNAQILYEKTGNIPEGYILTEEGKVIKDEKVQRENNIGREEKSTDDSMQL